MKRRFLRSGPPTIRIGGKVYAQALALIIFKCAECLGELKYHNAGICCAADPAHRFFVHRDDAVRLAAERAGQLDEVKAVYEIVDGQLVPRKELLSDAN